MFVFHLISAITMPGGKSVFATIQDVDAPSQGARTTLVMFDSSADFFEEVIGFRSVISPGVGCVLAQVVHGDGFAIDGDTGYRTSDGFAVHRSVIQFAMVHSRTEVISRYGRKRGEKIIRRIKKDMTRMSMEAEIRNDVFSPCNYGREGEAIRSRLLEEMADSIDRGVPRRIFVTDLLLADRRVIVVYDIDRDTIAGVVGFRKRINAVRCSVEEWLTAHMGSLELVVIKPIPEICNAIVRAGLVGVSRVPMSLAGMIPDNSGSVMIDRITEDAEVDAISDWYLNISRTLERRKYSSTDLNRFHNSMMFGDGGE